MMANPYIYSALIIGLMMLVVFLLAQIVRDNSIVDSAWGLGFVLICWAIYIIYDTPPTYFVILIVTSLWGIRLFGHIFSRSLKNKQEDWRYRKWREEWGAQVLLKSFLKVFVLQGLIMWIVAFPLMQITSNNESLSIIQYVGLILWLIGFLWEAVADWQLSNFIKYKKTGKNVLMTGLWASSRHPNYFGEILLWIGISLISLAHSDSWISLISPIVMSSVLIFISAPMMEAKYAKENRYSKSYLNQTNVIFPKIF